MRRRLTSRGITGHVRQVGFGGDSKGYVKLGNGSEEEAGAFKERLRAAALSEWGHGSAQPSQVESGSGR